MSDGVKRDSEKRETLDDYSLKPVPPDKRKSWLDIAVVWIGVAIVLSALLRGMMVGMGLGSIPNVLLAYLLGEVLLVGMMALTGFLGARLGLSTPLLARVSFGEKGSLLISFCLAIAFMGWFGVQAGLFAETLKAFAKTPLPVPLLAFLSGILMMIPAVFGFRGLKVLSWCAVPPMVVVFLYAAVKLGFHFLPRQELIGLAQSHSPSPYPVSLGAAASIVAGGFIVGAVTSADVFRFARPRFKDIVAAASLAMGTSALMQLVGSVLAMRTGLYHEHLPRLIISSEYAGLGIVGFLAIGFAQWTTNDSNLYSSVLAFNAIIRWTRWKLALIVGVLASFLAALGILARLELFLSVLSIAVGPIGGILVADYYLLGKAKNSNRAATKSWNPVALGAYALSFLVGWTTSGHPFKIGVFPFSIFAFNGILSAVLFYWAGMKIFNEHRQTGR
ncbi:MAG: cytosine permease [Candidatus Aminicenantes bacterium]|nr:cytosine permease [Candidatus Aminicenantes bacterium]